MFEGICKDYILKASSKGDIFPEEASIEILNKIINIFINHTLKLHSLLKKKQYVEALDKARLLCSFEENLSKEIQYISSFYQAGRKEFKEAIDRINIIKNESKASLKAGILLLKESNKTVFPLSLFDYLVK